MGKINSKNGQVTLHGKVTFNGAYLLTKKIAMTSRIYEFILFVTANVQEKWSLIWTSLKNLTSIDNDR